MPVIFLDSGDSGENITRSIMHDVIKDIVELTKIPTDKIQYVGEIAQGLSVGSSMGSLNEATFNKGSFLRVSAVESLDETGVYASSMTSEEHLDLFTDTSLGIRIKPTYTAHSATVTFTYRAQSKGEANRLRNTFRSLLERGFLSKTHDVKYTYPLNESSLVILAHLHELRERVDGYDEDLADYLTRYMAEQITAVTNQAGNNASLMVNETQLGTQGYFDFDMPPEESREGSGSTWNIEFSYVHKYQKPTGVRMHYPASVHNQLIGATYRPTVDLNYTLPKEHTVLSQVHEKLQWSNNAPVRVGAIRVPSFDDWELPLPMKTVTGMFRFLIKINPNDTTVLDLNKLGDNTLLQPLLDYIDAANEDAFLYGRCAIHIALWRNDEPVDHTSLSVSNGVISCSKPLSLRDVHHVSIGIVHDLVTLFDKGITLLCKHPEACHILMMALEPTLEKAGLLPKIYNGAIREYDFRIAIKYIGTSSRHYVTNGYVDRVRTAYCTITARR